MSDERRFNEDEVAEILERATATDTSIAHGPPAGDEGTGLTLRELQRIGEEVGISADRISEAATAVASRPSERPVRTLLGVPRSVSRIIPLGRELTDDEWTRVVVMLRETFGARGRTESLGALRSWSNGNLQVHIEPDGDAWRVRMRTVKGNAGPRVMAGTALTAFGAVALVAVGFQDAAAWSFLGPAIMSLAGLAQLGWVRTELPRWADERGRQMDEIGQRIRKLIEPQEHAPRGSVG